jgi:hypothetical protein
MAALTAEGDGGGQCLPCLLLCMQVRQDMSLVECALSEGGIVIMVGD